MRKNNKIIKPMKEGYEQVEFLPGGGSYRYSTQIWMHVGTPLGNWKYAFKDIKRR